jgi:hypothetical protein
MVINKRFNRVTEENQFEDDDKEKFSHKRQIVSVFYSNSEDKKKYESETETKNKKESKKNHVLLEIRMSGDFE